MADKVYPEGVTAMDHVKHDMKMGRFPNQSSVETFLAERATLAAQEKVGHLPSGPSERDSDGDTDQIVDWTELNRLFAQIPDGPWQVSRSSDYQIRQIDTDPTNKHHWPHQLCQSIAGQRASCDDAVFNFIAGVLNAWPQISASAPASDGSSYLAALSAGATQGALSIWTPPSEEINEPSAYVAEISGIFLVSDATGVLSPPDCDAAFIVALVNAYRSGKLKEIDPA